MCLQIAWNNACAQQGYIRAHCGNSVTHKVLLVLAQTVTWLLEQWLFSEARHEYSKAARQLTSAKEFCNTAHFSPLLTQLWTRGPANSKPKPIPDSKAYLKLGLIRVKIQSTEASESELKWLDPVSCAKEPSVTGWGMAASSVTASGPPCDRAGGQADRATTLRWNTLRMHQLQGCPHALKRSCQPQFCQWMESSAQMISLSLAPIPISVTSGLVLPGMKTSAIFRCVSLWSYFLLWKKTEI